MIAHHKETSIEEMNGRDQKGEEKDNVWEFMNKRINLTKSGKEAVTVYIIKYIPA